MEGNLDRVQHAIGSSGLVVGICVIIMSGGFGMTNLGGDAGGRYSWGRRIGRRIERGRFRVCESVLQCGFVCGGLVVFIHFWIAWWSASINNRAMCANLGCLRS